MKKNYVIPVEWFPSPLEVTGGSNVMTMGQENGADIGFSSPLEVIGGSYTEGANDTAIITSVSVPSRGDWGF